MERLWIHESELRAIAQETASWTTETGGDLFGAWEPAPVVLLATRLGPQSQRSQHSCRFDLAYLEQLSRTLAIDWGLHYLGDWHSHGISEYTSPSRTDRERIGRVLRRLRFPRLIESITTRLSADTDTVAVHAYGFAAESWFDPSKFEIAVLPGVSPVREVLALRDDHALEQDWGRWEAVPLGSIDGFDPAAAADGYLAGHHQELIAQRAIDELACCLEEAFPEAAVQTPLNLDREMSVPTVRGELTLRFAAQWPFPLRSVAVGQEGHRVRHEGLLSGTTAFQPAAVIKVCRQVLNRQDQLAAGSGTSSDPSPSGQS